MCAYVNVIAFGIFILPKDDNTSLIIVNLLWKLLCSNKEVSSHFCINLRNIYFFIHIIVLETIPGLSKGVILLRKSK